MKAARLYQAGQPLQVEEIADPTLRPGGVIIKVGGAHIPAFSTKVLSGELGYAFPPLPFTPGTSAVGIVEAVADDVFGFEPGQAVFCDPFVASRTMTDTADGILIGWTALAPASGQMQSLWTDGPFAEKVLWPAECLTPLTVDPTWSWAQLACLGYLAIPYGGLLKGQLVPGQSLIVNGATGGLGGGAVLVALAMGAAQVVAVGRDQATLDQLVQLDPNRVVAVAMSGPQDHAEQLRQVTGGADLLLDVLGGVTDPGPTMAAIGALRPGGTAVLMGGVQAQLPLTYMQIMLSQLSIHGQFMFPKSAPGTLVRLIKSGILKLDAIQAQAFGLDQVNEAVAKAATLKGINYAVLTPTGE